VNRYRLTVPERRAEEALARMLELFPAGVEREDRGGLVTVSGYADAAPAPGLEAEPVAGGWEDAWRAFHRPVEAAGLWIGPPWLEPVEPAVVIDPGSAFGTGGHGSTRAALELLPRLPRGSLLDLGCGSGVLSVAAVRLGFRPVHALDLDPLAVAATEQNAARNGVEVAAARADVLTDPLPPAAAWIANLELPLIERLLGRGDLPPAIVVSGLLSSQTAGGGERVEVDGWAAELLRR
jgi:ribosomal protein L11 methyltransferase